jgi:hypothetical protein
VCTRGGLFCHQQVGYALRHHPPLLLLKLDNPVRLDRPDQLALVALAAGGRGWAVPPPSKVSLGPSGKRDPHVPQLACAPPDLPLAVGRDVADLGVLIPTVVRRAHLPRKSTLPSTLSANNTLYIYKV